MPKTVILNKNHLMETANGDTGNLLWGGAACLALDIIVTNQQGTSPTLQILVDRLLADGITYDNIWDSTALAVPASFPKGVSIGPGCSVKEEIGASGRIRWQIGGSSNPGVAFNLSLQGE